MAASDPNQHSDHSPVAGGEPAPSELCERLREEIARAERHGTQLSCLLVAFDNLEQMTREHGSELRAQTLEYVVQALRRELRCFDRVGVTNEGEMIVLLPGADSPRGEIVGRRALERLRTIKVEAGGTRMPLQVSMGLAAWRAELSAQAMVAQARAALRNLEEAHGPASIIPPPAGGGADASGEHPGPAEGPHGGRGGSAPTGRVSGQ
jgi:diguanylate cyclase (GGDEF)-like protein